MIKINSNLLVVSIVCCSALIMFFYYQYNTPYNQCVRAYVNDHKPKYFSDKEEAWDDVIYTREENNYYKVMPNFVPKPVLKDSYFDSRDFGIETIKISRESRLNEISRQSNTLCAKWFNK